MVRGVAPGHDRQTTKGLRMFKAKKRSAGNRT